MPTLFNLSLRGASAHPELVEGRGNLDEAEQTATNRRCYGEEIATWFDRLTMSDCAPRNDKVGTREWVPPTAAVFHPAAAVSRWGLTTLATSATARSISSAVVKRPTENLSVPIAYSRGMPIASSTLDTSTRSL